MSNPNYKFYEIAEDAERVALFATEIAALFREATKDGINAYREGIIKRNTNLVEQGMRRLRQEVEPSHFLTHGGRASVDAHRRRREELEDN